LVGVDLTCAGSGGGDLVNISNFGAKCNLVLGSPQQTDGKDNSAFHGNSGWKVPMYSCITATQALLKTVTFRFEGVDALSGLSVTDIRDKKYDSTDNMPLWGIESFDETTGWFLDTINPIWGLVSPELAVTSANLSTTRKESFFLPAYSRFGLDLPTRTIAGG